MVKLDRTRLRPDPHQFPSPPHHDAADWTLYAASSSFREGMPCVVKSPAGRIRRYGIDRIAAIGRPWRGCVLTGRSGSFYVDSGRSCVQPTGGASLAPLLPEVVDAALRGHVWIDGRPAGVDATAASGASAAAAETLLALFPPPEAPPPEVRPPPTTRTS